MQRRAILLAGLGFACAATVPCAALARDAAKAPALMLAQDYRAGMSLDDQWVSEKYDGVRGYWDGKQFWTRGGEPVATPAWFTEGLPRTAMDGELWAGRGRFTQALSTVRSQTPADKDWQAMRFMAFDLPAERGDFTARLLRLRMLLPVTGAPWIVAVPQERATTHEALQQLLDKTVRMGGEGLVLHRGNSRYLAGRSADLLKFKPYDDAEARVVGHVGGRGKHNGRLGALLVETPEGQRFKIGSGFTDAERDEPPAIGSWVSYRYNGTNPGGLPRFARFMRVREAAGG